MPRDHTPFEAFTALHVVDACAHARSKLLAMQEHVVPAADIRAIRGQILAALGDADRLLAEMEGEPLTEARLRADAEALTAVIVAFMRRHGEASARCAATAVLAEAEPMPLPATTRRQQPDPPVAISTRIMRRDSELDADVDEGPPARPRLPPACADDGLPATDDFPSDGDPPPPGRSSRPPDLDEALDVPVHDAPTFGDRTRRTTDMTEDEEAAAAMPQHTSRPSEPPVRSTRTQTEINDAVAAAARAIDEAERAAEAAEEAAMAARPPPPPRDPMDDFRRNIRKPPFEVDASRPGKLLVPRRWTTDPDIELFVRAYGLVKGPLVAQRTVPFSHEIHAIMMSVAAQQGDDVPMWAYHAFEQWADAGCQIPNALRSRMRYPMKANVDLFMSECVIDAIQRIGRAEMTWPINVLRGVLLDASGAVSREDAGLVPTSKPSRPTDPSGYAIAVAYDQSYRLP